MESIIMNRSNQHTVFSPEYFETCPPEELGISSSSILNFIEAVDQRSIKLHSLMILRHGKCAASIWWRPYSPEIPHHLYSLSKSFTSAAIGFAVDEGLLSLDDRITKFFPRRVGKRADPRIYSVTVEHLLNMTSGAVLVNETGMYAKSDWVEWYLNAPLTSFPGEKFVYNSLNTYMLSAIIRKVSGVGLTEYLDERLFKPLNIETPIWQKCPMGIECGGWGLALKTEDIAKFGQLYLNNGVWEGKQLLPKGWAETSGSFHADTTSDTKFTDNPNSTAGYGYQFWLCRNEGWYRADGMMGQYAIIMPDKDMVIVTTAGCPVQLDVLDVLWDTLIPAIDVIPEKSEPGPYYKKLNDLAAQISLPTPQAVARAREIEDRISGRVYELPINLFSMLPLVVRYLYDLTPMGIDSLRFDFGDDISYLHWHEDGCDMCVPFSLNGEFTACTLNYSGSEFETRVFAAWVDQKTLEIDIRLIRTPHMLVARFVFEDDVIKICCSEQPTMEESAKYMVNLVKPLRSVSQPLAKFVGKYFNPVLTGKLKNDSTAPLVN